MNAKSRIVRLALAACAVSFAGLASALDITEDTEWTTADAQSHASDDIAIAEDATLTVTLAEDSDAVTLSGAISGDGALKFAGLGSLTLSGANTFAGGFYLASTDTVTTKGTVYAQTATALGSGTVHIDARAWVCLNVAAATTFANAFDFTDAGVLCFMPTAKGATFTMNGAITASSHFFFSTSYKGSTTYAALSSSITFNNTITAPANCFLTFIGSHGAWYTAVHFKQKVTAGAVRNFNSTWGGEPDTIWGSMGSGSCPVYFYVANEIGRVVPYFNSRGYILTGDGAFGTAATLSSADLRHDGYRHGGSINFGTKDQEVSSIQLLDVYGYKYNHHNAYLKCSSALTLTVSGGGSYVTDWMLCDTLSLNWNAPNAADTLSLSNETHTTSGKITVTKGVVHAGGPNVSFPNLTAIEVKADGTFALVNTEQANALGKVTALDVAGRFELGDGLSNPFDTSRAEPPTLTLATGGKMKVPAGCSLVFKNVTVGGVLQPFKTYTKGNCDWIEGDGEVSSVGLIVLDKAAIDAYTGDTLDTDNAIIKFQLADEETATWDKPITGNGTINIVGTGGTLTFADITSTFTGTVSVKGLTNVEFAGPNAFGTGTIEFDYENAKLGTEVAYYGCWGRPAVYFTGGFTVSNPLRVTKNAVIGFKDGNFTVNSDLTATSTFKLRGASNKTITWKGDIEAAGQEVIMLGNSFRAAWKFYGNIRADKFYGYCPDWAGGTYYIYGTTDVGMVSPSMNSFYAAVPGLFGENTVLQTHYSVQYHRIDAGGWLRLWNDATVDHCETPTGLLAVEPTTGRLYFTGDKNKPVWRGDAVVDDNKNKTLTMKGSKDCWAWTCFRDTVSVDWAPTGDYTFAVSNRDHTTSGSITVSRGTFLSGAGNTFNYLSRLVVRDGAKFIADPGYDYRTFANTTALEIWGSGQVQVEKDETFASVRTNGVFLADGDYTAATATWLKGAGKLTVDSSYDTRKTWKNPEDGTWKTAAKWNGNAVPTASDDVSVDAPGTYTVTVDEEGAAFKTLTVGGQSTGAVTVDVAADTTVANGSTVTVKKGGTLKVTEGTLTFVNTTKNGVYPLVMDPDGTFEASGEALVKLDNVDYTKKYDTGFFTGNIAFKGNSVFEPAVNRVVTDGSNGDTTSEFVDHAVCGPADMAQQPSTLSLGSSTGTATLRLASDATHEPARIIQIGYNSQNGRLVLENGTLKISNTSGRFGVATWYYTSAVVEPVGTFEMTGGTLLMDIDCSTSTSEPRGMVVGDGWVCGQSPSGSHVPNASFHTGTMTLSGGVVTNSYGRKGMLGIGLGKADGKLLQSGGTVAWPTADKLASAVIGMGGGTGLWQMTGGTANVGANVYVGGVTTNEYGVFWKSVSEATYYVAVIGLYPDAAQGTLAIADATMTVGGNLVLSGDGEGTLALSKGANLTVAGYLDARDGSKLVVDARGIEGNRATLATFGGTTAAFGADNITFCQDDGAGYELRISPNSIRVVKPMGLIMMIR